MAAQQGAEDEAAPIPTPPAPRVLLATMAREAISIPTHVGIVMALATGRLAAHVAITSGPYLDAGRNKAIDGGLTSRDADGNLLWDWFLFVDSDIEFTNDHLDALTTVIGHPSYDPSRYPVIGGVYTNPYDDTGVPGEEPQMVDGKVVGGFFGPVCYEWVERDDLAGELNGVPTYTTRRLSRTALATLPPVNEPWNPPSPNGSPSPVTEVCAIGTGFLAIHHALIAQMYDTYGEPLPWFDEPIVNRVHYGEDFGFCFRVRDLGYPVLAHRGCTPLHNKTTKLI